MENTPGFDDRLSLTTDQWFWVMQISGWMILAFVWFMVYTVTFGQSELPYVLHPFIQSVLGIVFSWPLRRLFHWSWDMGIIKTLLVVTLAVVFFSFLWTIARLISFIWISGEVKNFLPEFSLWYFPGFLVFACWAALYHVFRYYRFLQAERKNLLRSEAGRRDEQLKREQAERLAREAQLKMLQYQLNPHFLFNTMSAITALVNSGRNADASTMIDSLSSFLRSALDGDPLHRVTLAEEIKSLDTYLNIEKTRFGDRLNTEYCLSEDDLAFRVPGMILQPLVENVIRHAVRASTNPVTLTISARATDEFLEVWVDDDGPGMQRLHEKLPHSEGVGLRNIRERLHNIYGQTNLMRFENRNNGGLRVVLQFPALRAETQLIQPQEHSAHGQTDMHHSR